jgi:polysaccharide deacetylase family protein (PEP-CTERM system associated)
MKTVFLFSVDLEDNRLLLSNFEKLPERVPQMTERYLEFLARSEAKCTFFVVGNMARKYPELLRRIHNEGHELACHTDAHCPLDLLGPENFETDLVANIQSIVDIGLPYPKGFRAPTLSLTENTQWAYRILKKYNILYSSSVLPAPNPLYGWPNFGYKLRNIDGVTELPITLVPNYLLKVPLGAGTYFRILPQPLVKYFFRKLFLKQNYITGYFHPYDIDFEQKHFMHPGINNNVLYNFLMYYNRKNVLDRITDLKGSLNLAIDTYWSFLSKFCEVPRT